MANVRLEHGRHGELRVVAVRDLLPGEELVDNYMAEVGDAPRLRQETRLRLRERWRFECGCERCVAEGPLLASLPPPPPADAATPCAPVVVASDSDAAPSVLLGVNSWDAAGDAGFGGWSGEAGCGGADVGWWGGEPAGAGTAWGGVA